MFDICEYRTNTLISSECSQAWPQILKDDGDDNGDGSGNGGKAVVGVA